MTLMAAVIGDVIASRTFADRVGLHERLAGVLERVNTRLAPATPLRFTVGDEFQGAFTTIEEALRATLRLRVGLLSTGADLRHGIGWGEVSTLQDVPRVEDGPGWWAAREAIEAVHEAETHPSTRWARTAMRGAGAGPLPSALLLLRDRSVTALDERGVVILLGLLDGLTQRQIAEDLGITASAVSQRVRADGLDALVASDQALEAWPQATG